MPPRSSLPKVEDTLFSSLEDNRIIYVNGIFDEDMVKDVFEKIVILEKKNPKKDILIIIDSYGGYCHSFLGIHDIIQMCRCDVATLCIGKAMSAAQFLLMSGTKGKRFSSKNARIMMHELSSGVYGKLSDMEVEMEENKVIQDTLEKLIIQHTGLTKSKIKSLMENDSYFSPEEAKGLGIIDEVIESNAELYKKIKL